MDPTAFREAHQTLGLTDGELAEELGVTPDIIRRWAAGEVRIPRRYAREVAWRSAMAARVTALSASGLSECPWVLAHADALLECANLSALEQHQREAETHAATCELCAARERYEAEHLGRAPLPPYVAGWMRPFFWIAETPSWLVPPLLGALLLGAVVSFRILFALPALSTRPGGARRSW